MSESLHGKNTQQLIDQGWILLTDKDSNELVGLRSVIWHWDSMTWAERTYYGGKYGFNPNGILDIHFSQQTPKVGSFGLSWSTALNKDIVVPESSLAGSNDRLRILLAQSRVAVEQSSHDGNTLAHFGPDGTVVLTDEYLWGLPYPNHDGYIDLNERYTCSWEVSSETWCPDAPWWAIGPNVEALESFR